MQYSKKSLATFILLAFVPVWAACFCMMASPVTQIAMLTIFAGFMFMPALANLLTRLICREGFADLYLRPRFRGHWGGYIAAYLLPAAVCALGAAVYFLAFPGKFDPTFAALTAQGITQNVRPIFLATQVGLVLLAPLINLIPCLGEELGWRGYLLPKLALRMPASRAALVSGVIWGIWHAPMIALGHNYGVGYAGYPWLGILLMTLFCVLFGTFAALVTFRTKSAIPAALAHAGLNGTASIGLLFCTADFNPLVGPYPMGVVGGIPVLVLGIISLLLIKRNETAAGDQPDAAAVPGETL